MSISIWHISCTKRETQRRRQIERNRVREREGEWGKNHSFIRTYNSKIVSLITFVYGDISLRELVDLSRAWIVI